MRKKYVIYFLAFCLAAVLLFSWLSFGQNGLIALFTIQKQREESAAALIDLRQKNKLLASEIRRLREDPKYFELTARKELGLVRENEVIYRLKERERGPIARPIQGK